jgi:flagellar biosynthetic protein FliP
MMPKPAATNVQRLTSALAVVLAFSFAVDRAVAMPMPQPSVPASTDPMSPPRVLTTTTHTRPPAPLPKAAASAAPLPLESSVRPVSSEQSVSSEQAGSSEQVLPPRREVSLPPNVSHTPARLDESPGFESLQLPGGLGGPAEWTSPEGLSSALQSLALLTVVSLAPAVLMMTTCFVRIALVLGLLRQSLGTQQLPSNQVVTSLAMFMTLLVMAPTWQKVYHDAVVPYTSHEITVEEAWDAGVKPVRGFMSAQIDRTGNSADIWLFYKYLPADTPSPSSYDDVPLTVLLPAFMLSELKTAFLIGFQIFLPFLVIDLVVASVTISMGMFMLPPALVSLPLKLLLFVLVDGWHLVVGMLLDSFQIVT